jgi:hypothetical protein
MVTFQAVTSGRAPRLRAASSTAMFTPVRLAVTSRIDHGMVIRTCAAARPSGEPTSGSSVWISTSTNAMYTLPPITMPGTIKGDISRFRIASRPGNRMRARAKLAGRVTSRPAAVASRATRKLVQKPLRNCGCCASAAYQRSE